MPFVIYAHLNKIDHTQKHIRNTQVVDMIINLSVVMMTNLANLCKFTEEKMLFINSWKRLLKTLKIAKKTANKHFKETIEKVCRR